MSGFGSGKPQAIAMALALSTGCGRDAPLSEPSKIIGTDDLVEVTPTVDNVPAPFAGIVDAIAITIGCTATHIGDGILLTAGHCLAFDRFPRQEHQPCADIEVEFGRRQGHTPRVTRCLEIVAAEFSDARDFAYLRIADPPIAVVPVRSSTTTSEAAALSVLSHPYGRPLSWSGFCAPMPDQGPEDERLTRLRHDCDTLNGSSGAAILDATTGEVVAVHGGAASGNLPWNYATRIEATEWQP